VLADGAGWQRGALLAIYPHGLFESTGVIRALFGADAPTLEDTLDGLADLIDARFPAGVLASLLE
jgi:adenosylcobyric acid synthase